MEKKTDRRVIKTKHAIFKAFVELLNEKDVNQITITDIAKKANINRKTFYNYYSDAYEVMEEIENLTVEAFINNMGTVKFTNMADFLTETVNKDLEFFNLLFKTNNRSFLIVKIVEALKEYVQKRIEESNELDIPRFEVVSNFYLSGVLSVYMNWFMNNYDQSIEEISALLTELVLHGIQKNWPGN